MKLEHLEYFVHMKNSRSLSEASAKANISQQGYGKVIAALEEALGTKLVYRDARGAHLTDSGLAFMPHAEAIVTEYKAAKAGLKLQREDIKTLNDFEGNIALSNVCIVTFEALLSGSNLLGNANKSEMPLNALITMADDPDWICLGDICTQIYTDYQTRWDIEVLGTGRVGVIVPPKFLQGLTLSDASTIAQHLPLGMFDCYASREIYKVLFSDEKAERVKLRTTSDKLLMEGLSRGDFAVLNDSFNWEHFDPSKKVGTNAYVFIPFRTEMTSLFGFVRKKGLPYSAEQRKVIDSFKRMYENVGRRS